MAALLTGGIIGGSFGAVAGAATAPHALTTTGLGYTSLSSPVRIADTRAGATDPATYAGKTLAEGTGLTVDIPASAGLPATASAVVVHITAVNPAAPGYLSVYPAGASNPGTANVTFGAGQTIGNTVTVGLGTDATTSATQALTVFDGPATGGGSVDFTADLEGYYAPQTGTSGGAYVPLSPVRVYDSRTGSNEPGAGTTLTNGGSDNVTVTGTDGVPSTATAVAVNIATTNATSSSYISAYPTGAAPAVPVANQNFTAGETLSSQAVVGVGTGGAITVSNNSGNLDIVVDVDGYFTAAGGSGALFTALSTPVRLLDTRPTGVAGGASATATLSGTGATAGVLSIADVAGTGSNYLTAYPAGGSVPLAANVNYTTTDAYNVVENSAYAIAGTGGGVSVYNGPAGATTANIVIDESGYFSGAAVASNTYTVSPTTASSVTSGGTITYTATGLPTTAGTTAHVALFPCTATGAPVTPTATAGAFTAPTVGGAAVAGDAQGQGTTDTSGASIASINGVATAGGTTTTSVSPTGGTFTFTVTSAKADCTIPVVYTGGATLLVNANGTSQTGYTVGIGGSGSFTAPAAPAAAGYTVAVQSVNAAAGTFTGTTGGNTYSFSDGATGSTYFYSGGVPITEAQFVSYLSGLVTTDEPNTTTPQNILGDTVTIAPYSPTLASTYTLTADVPNAPTAVTATYSATAYVSGGISQPGEIVKWTPPINPDVDGYSIYASTIVGGVAGAPAFVANEVTTGVPNNTTITSPTSPEFIDESAYAGGTELEYYVFANSPAASGPFSAGSNTVTAGTGPGTPAIVSVAITPSVAGTLHTTGGSAGTVTGGTAGTAIITYNEPVTAAAVAADFTYSNSGGTNGAAKAISGASVTGSGTTTLTVTFPQVSGIAGTYAQTVVAVPGIGDTFSYAVPTPQTTADAVFAGTTPPQYESAQTVTDTGTPTATTSTGTPPSNPLT
jgi:hypothetical protein